MENFLIQTAFQDKEKGWYSYMSVHPKGKTGKASLPEQAF